MEKNIFDKVFIDAEKETIRRYLEIIMEQLKEEDFNGVETYAGYLLRSATRLNAYDGVSEVAFVDENN